MIAVRVEKPLLVEIEIPHRLGDRLLPRLLQRLLEALREGIAAGAFGGDRLLEDRFATRGFLCEDPAVRSTTRVDRRAGPLRAARRVAG